MPLICQSLLRFVLGTRELLDWLCGVHGHRLPAIISSGVARVVLPFCQLPCGMPETANEQLGSVKVCNSPSARICNWSVFLSSFCSLSCHAGSVQVAILLSNKSSLG